jgi:hypothetical protein
MDDNERIEAVSTAGAAGQPLPDDTTIYCPRCLYNLRGVREAGLDCCPECGTSLDFDQLRSMAQTGLDLAASRGGSWSAGFSLRRGGFTVRCGSGTTSSDCRRGGRRTSWFWRLPSAFCCF